MLKKCAVYSLTDDPEVRLYSIDGQHSSKGE